MNIPQELRNLVTDTQMKYIEAVEKYGGVRSAAAALGVNHSVVSRAVLAVKKNLGKHHLKIAENRAAVPTNSIPKLLVIPDMQVRPNTDLTYVRCIGEYIAAKKPDVIVNLGDMADMESLSSYDKGKRSFEGRRYKHDIGSAVLAQQLLFGPMQKYNKANPDKPYIPRTIFLEGNHEERGRRVVQMDPALHGTISILRDLRIHEYWKEVHKFLEVVIVGGIAFSHYFCTGAMQRPASTATAQLKKMHMSCIAGHQQGRQAYSEKAADGRLLTSIIAGSSYDGDMDYLGKQGNKHWRGIIMLHSVENGEFDEVYIPTKYLIEKYGKNMTKVTYDSAEHEEDD